VCVTHGIRIVMVVTSTQSRSSKDVFSIQFSATLGVIIIKVGQGDVFPQVILVSLYNQHSHGNRKMLF
jgi:hypothetical protein